VTEIFACELLLRVYTVLLIARGSSTRGSESQSLLDQISADISHIASSARRQFLLLHADYSWSLTLYRLQKRLDRWSDILLAPTLVTGRFERFWINRANASEWTDHPWNLMADRDAAGVLLRRAIRNGVPADSVIPAPRSRHIEKLLMATLMLIPERDFTTDGVLLSLEQRRQSATPPNSKPDRPH
jgi:hypothetical protein